MTPENEKAFKRQADHHQGSIEKLESLYDRVKGSPEVILTPDEEGRVLNAIISHLDWQYSQYEE